MNWRTLSLLPFFLLFAACGGVTNDPSEHEPGGSPGGSGGATPTPTPTPIPTPTPQAQSAICPGALTQDVHDVALWYQDETGVTFVHHDGTSSVAFVVPADTPGLSTQASAGGERIFVASHSSTGFPSSMRMYDRSGVQLAQHTITQGYVLSPFADDAGRVAFHVGNGGAPTAYLWDGSAIQNLGAWIPTGPAQDGWVPARATWDSDTTHAFVSTAGETRVVYKGKSSVQPAGASLIWVDAEARVLRVATPTSTQALPLGGFGVSDIDAPLIHQVRDGVALLARNKWDTGDVLVVDVQSGQMRHVADTQKEETPLAFYCNATRPGYLASDGSLLRSRIAKGQLQLWRETASSAFPIGMPLSGVALLSVVERGGTVGIVGSDGSDTYCGTPSDIWQQPAPAGTLPGDSVQFVRKDGATQLGTFSHSFDEPALHASGLCVITQDYEGPGYQQRVWSLQSDAVFSLPESAKAPVAWIE
jgi:hypothetical protein